MDIKPPYGYQEIVPLTKTHRVVLPTEDGLPAAFRSLGSLPLSFTEFAAACRDYPITFITGDGGKSSVAMAILGLENQQNLFVRADAGWDRAAYAHLISLNKFAHLLDRRVAMAKLSFPSPQPSLH